MWIARDKDGGLFMYSMFPVQIDDWFYSQPGDNFTGSICDELFPEITFENSPKEVEIIIKE